MTELQRWDTDSGTIVVEGDDEMLGFASVVRSPGEVARVGSVRFEEALTSFRDSASKPAAGWGPASCPMTSTS